LLWPAMIVQLVGNGMAAALATTPANGNQPSFTAVPTAPTISIESEAPKAA
jgi:hypothetical protein